MNRYTNYDELLREVSENVATNPNARCHQLLKAIIDAPIVEVVRCRDCKYSSQWYADTRLCSFWCETGIGVHNDDFCSRGKRRENNAET